MKETEAMWNFAGNMRFQNITEVKLIFMFGVGEASLLNGFKQAKPTINEVESVFTVGRVSC